MWHSRPMRCAVFGSLALCVTVGSVVWASADVVRSQETLSVDGVLLFNPCADEFMELSGQFHVRSRTVTDASGGMNVTVHQRLTATGVGVDSGDRYVVNDRSSETERVNAHDAQSTITFHASARLIAPGGSPNAHITRTVVLVVDANGETRVDRDPGLVVECR